MKTALTIAGSDSGGGAGIQADLKTFAALGVHGTCAITAITAQSTTEVRRVEAVKPEMVRAQIETVLDDFDVHAVKTGMLFDAAIIDTVTSMLRERGMRAVVDPVMIASSGAFLIEGSAVQAYNALFTQAIVLTPNLPEVQRLLGFLPEAIEEMVDAARMLLARGPEAVLIKGGHRRGPPSDVLVERTGAVTRLESERIDTRSTHGTGCTYASAIAAFLAKSEPLKTSVERAHSYLQQAIAGAPRIPVLGRGNGPVHHFHKFYALS